MKNLGNASGAVFPGGIPAVYISTVWGNWGFHDGAVNSCAIKRSEYIVYKVRMNLITSLTLNEKITREKEKRARWRYYMYNPALDSEN